MTDSCAYFIMRVRYCCGTINCVKVLPCSTFGELNFRYNKSFFFKNVALPMVSFASHRLLAVKKKGKGLLFNVDSRRKSTWYGWNDLFPAESTVRVITSPIIQSRPILLATIPG